jgi:hypothetical protein
MGLVCPWRWSGRYASGFPIREERTARRVPPEPGVPHEVDRRSSCGTPFSEGGDSRWAPQHAQTC